MIAFFDHRSVRMTQSSTYTDGLDRNPGLFSITALGTSLHSGHINSNTQIVNLLKSSELLMRENSPVVV